MINGFFKIVPSDVAYISNKLGKGQASKDLSGEEKSKVKHAAIRILAALGMAFSLLQVTHAVLGNNLSKVIIYAGLYAVTHDIFVISLNSEKTPLGKVVLLGKAILSDVKDLLGGKKDEKDVPSHPYSEGTFFKPVWDSYFNTK